MLREIAPAIREVFWIAQVWNDHNFDANDIRKKCEKIAHQLGVEGRDVDDPVRGANRWLAECEAALEE